MSKSDTPQIEHTALEPIPSAGAEEVAELNHAVYGLGDWEQFIVTDGKEVQRSADRVMNEGGRE